MAGYRQIHTKIWKDHWFLDLSANDKLLFIYLFSNERACLAGIYELPIKVIAFETDLSREQIEHALARFEDAGKVFYREGIVWVVNLIQYNASSLSSSKIRTNIERSVTDIKDCPLRREWLKHYNSLVPQEQAIELPANGQGYPMDTLSIGNPHEHEHEHEHEQDTMGRDAPANNLPHNLDGWLTFVREGKGQSGGMTARLGRMLVTLWPERYDGLDPPYSEIGGVARNVDGAARLAQLMWQANAYNVTGDPLKYCSKMHSNSKDDSHTVADQIDRIAAWAEEE